MKKNNLSPSELRAEIASRRQVLSATETAKLSRAVSEKFLLHLEDRSPKKVGLYRALPGEMDLTFLAGRLLEWGWELYFPRMEEGTLAFAQADLAEPKQWEPARYGIAEPVFECPHLPLGMELDGLFMPGVAFGLQGERVGRGAGFYDRYLANHRPKIRIALAFDFQLYDAIEQEPWDQPVHWIVTEAREVRAPGFKL